MAVDDSDGSATPAACGDFVSVHGDDVFSSQGEEVVGSPEVACSEIPNEFASYDFLEGFLHRVVEVSKTHVWYTTGPRKVPR